MDSPLLDVSTNTFRTSIGEGTYAGVAGTSPCARLRALLPLLVVVLVASGVIALVGLAEASGITPGGLDVRTYGDLALVQAGLFVVVALLSLLTFQQERAYWASGQLDILRRTRLVRWFPLGVVSLGANVLLVLWRWDPNAATSASGQILVCVECGLSLLACLANLTCVCAHLKNQNRARAASDGLGSGGGGAGFKATTPEQRVRLIHFLERRCGDLMAQVAAMHNASRGPNGDTSAREADALRQRVHAQESSIVLLQNERESLKDALRDADDRIQEIEVLLQIERDANAAVSLELGRGGGGGPLVGGVGGHPAVGVV